MADDIPRRIQVEKMTPAELAIRSAIITVEMLGADARLTRAVMLLQAALDYVADVHDDVPDRPQQWSPSEGAAHRLAALSQSLLDGSDKNGGYMDSRDREALEGELRYLRKHGVVS